MDSSIEHYKTNIKSHWSICGKPIADYVNHIGQWDQLEDPLADLYLEFEHGNLDVDSLETLFLLCIIKDLTASGWRVKAKNDKLVFKRSIEDDPKLTRRRNELMRDEQLLDHSPRKFIRLMETPRKTHRGFHSIFSLIRDGNDLASKIQEIKNSDPSKQEEKLSELCKPYICLAEVGDRCDHTGLKLRDIFRYFRTTWSSTYTPAPARQLSFLIRDAAADNHPIIGIAELRSSVLALKERDEWIGWTIDQIVEELRNGARQKDLNWLSQIVEDNLKEVRIDDFLLEGLFTKLDLKYPTKKLSDKLLSFSKQQLDEHQQRDAKIKGISDTDYLTHSGTNLFRSKRSRALSELLGIRDVLQRNNFDEIKPAKFKKLITENREFLAAVNKLISIAKSKSVGIDMMDITTAGAIAPYNHLLGGKLVCMLLASPELVNSYNERYKNQNSDIASKMAGRPIAREPRLSLLNTTSLYGRNSSQYNRIKIPVKEILGKGQGEIVYKKLGVSKGQGTSHISEMTKVVMKRLLEVQGRDNRVQNLMGEGTSPLLRRLRVASQVLGLPDELIVDHGNQRINYGIMLVSNAQDVLLNRTSKAKYFLGTGRSESKTKAIVDWWKRRWFYSRCFREEVIVALENESLAYPITHNARAPLYKILEPEPNLELDL
ncbi:DUF4338 domain-containing protein [Gammaproteobacteria bacterium]|nr:DUF4338 domain-containing protein [Gammaproteobacteria bacterium]